MGQRLGLECLSPLPARHLLDLGMPGMSGLEVARGLRVMVDFTCTCLGVGLGHGRVVVGAEKEPAAIPSLPPAHEVLCFSPKQRTAVGYGAFPAEANRSRAIGLALPAFPRAQSCHARTFLREGRWDTAAAVVSSTPPPLSEGILLPLWSRKADWTVGILDNDKSAKRPGYQVTEVDRAFLVLAGQPERRPG